MGEVVTWGGGGREAEIARVMASSGGVSRSYLAHSHAGARVMEGVENLPAEVSDFKGLTDFAREKDAFVVIGPEDPLIEGRADELRAKGVKTFGLSKKAARLEGSKAFAIERMRDWGILHPDTFIAYKPEEALDYVANHYARDYVIKADGQAFGKGAILEDDDVKAVDTVLEMLSGDKFGDAGKTILFQERWTTESGDAPKEISGIAVCDGKNYVLLPIAQDHKRRDEGDEGPNTGGMGAYAPVPASLVPQKHLNSLHEIIGKVMHGMAKEHNAPVQGVLYVGAAEAPDDELGVFEFNGRFGDPETEVIFPVLEAAGIDLHDLLRSAAAGRLDPNLTIPQELGLAAITFCLAVEGYPDDPKKGQLVHGLEEKYKDILLHLAGITWKDGEYRTSGGRAMFVTAIDRDGDLNTAAAKAQAIIGDHGVGFPNMHFRRDVGYQALTRR